MSDTDLKEATKVDFIEEMAGRDGCSQARINDLSSKLKACGHPLRLRLLCAISREEDPCVSELWECVNQPQPVVSQHLSVLKERGIVDSQSKGNRRIYRIIDPFIAELIGSVRSASE